MEGGDGTASGAGRRGGIAGERGGGLMAGRRPIDDALELARERLRLLSEGDVVEEAARLEELDAGLLAACELAAADVRPGDAQLVDELMAITAAAGRLIAEELDATGARIRRLREGQAGNAAYRSASGM
jgi:hypothetical protein